MTARQEANERKRRLAFLGSANTPPSVPLPHGRCARDSGEGKLAMRYLGRPSPYPLLCAVFSQLSPVSPAWEDVEGHGYTTPALQDLASVRMGRQTHPNDPYRLLLFCSGLIPALYHTPLPKVDSSERHTYFPCAVLDCTANTPPVLGPSVCPFPGSCS